MNSRANQNGDPQAEPASRIRELVDPRASILAILALVLGLANSAYSITNWLRGPAPRVLPIDQVLIVPDEYPSGRHFVRFAARISYVNSGPATKNAIVLKESLSFNLGKEAFRQTWQSFDDFTGRGCSLSTVSSEDVRPIVIAGNASASHTTYFAPRSDFESEDRYKSFLEIDDMIEAIRHDDLKLTVEVEFDELESQATVCKPSITEADLSRLEERCAVTVSCAS